MHCLLIVLLVTLDLGLADGQGKLNQPPAVLSSSDGSNCRSKSESHLYMKTKLSSKNSEPFAQFLGHYEKMHQRCTEEDTISKLLKDNASPEETGESCQYVIHEGSGGFGNRMQGLLSSFLFAILTNRTLVVLPNGDESLLCQPFPHSSWILKPDHEITVMAGFSKGKGFTTAEKIRQKIKAGNHVLRANLYTGFGGDSKDAEFYCEDGQQALKNVRWVIVNQARYVGPSFAAIPSFRKEMDRLFPDRVIFTRIARYLLHPKNALWDRIVKAYKRNLEGADRLVGLQIRTFTTKHQPWAVPRIMECLVNISRVFPRPQIHPQDKEQSRSGSTIKVMVASMHRHLDEFQNIYRNGTTDNGTTVVFHTESNVGYEKWTVEQHATALHDIWLLSFCDILFTSSHSSFGVLAAGLSGTRPWSLNIVRREYGFENDPEKDWTTNGRPVCALSPSLEPCARVDSSRPCAAMDTGEALPYLRRNCTISIGYYWQIISEH